MRLLDGVLLDLAPVVLDAPADPIRAAEALVAVLRERGVTPAPGTNLGADPIGAMLRSSTRGTERDVTDGLVEVATPARPACSASSSTRPRCTTAAPPTPRSSATRMAVGAAYLRAAHRRRARRRRGGRPRRVPLRRHRRAVPDHRQAPRGPPAVGAGRSSSASVGRAARPAPARRHQPADDEQVRPLGEHAPHHRRGVRRRRRRRRRRHRAALRQPARPPRRLRPPDRPQHLARC